MKIVFFGEDSFSNVVLQSLIGAGHNILLVVSPYYQNLIHKRLENTCISNNIVYMRVPDIKDLGFIQKLGASTADMFVVSHFEKLLKKEIIEIPKAGCINLHPSLLPYYRGMSPQHWPIIINGDSETGITVHYIDETADTGDIILQRKIEIRPNMYVSDLQLEFINIYKSIVVESIQLTQNSQFIPFKQSALEGSYYGKLKRNQCQISLEKTQMQTMNLIRAVSKPYFGAFFDNIIIWKAHPANQIENQITSDFSGLGLHYSDKLGLFLKLFDGDIIIEKHEKTNNNETTNN